MMSASAVGWKVLTLPAGAGAAAGAEAPGAAPAARPCTRRSASTLRRVTGSSAGPLSPSAKRSTTPNGEAANLASGGIGPVATASGKLSALRSGRPEASLKSLGSSSRMGVCGAKGGMNCTPLTTVSPSPSPSRSGLRVSLSDFSRIASASLRGTGALNDRRIGRMGRQAACAFSRSQPKSALKGSRTV